MVVRWWFEGGSTVVRRWFDGGSTVVRRWFDGGSSFSHIESVLLLEFWLFKCVGNTDYKLCIIIYSM